MKSRIAKRILMTKMNKHVYVFVVIALFLGCSSKSEFSEELEGKWYGQRQALGSTYQIAVAKLVEQERNKLPDNEQVNLIFKDGWLLMEPRDKQNTIVDSARYKISNDSTLTAGQFKTKVMKITRDSLILYAKDELILKSLRIFTRQE